MIATQFDLTNVTGRQLFTKLHITPYNTPLAYEESIITNDAVIVFETSAAVTVNLVPGTYSIKLFGFNAESKFLISLPINIDNTTVNAADYLVAEPPFVNNTVAYAWVAGSLNTTNSNIQFVNNQFCIWDISQQVWLPLVCQNGVLGLGPALS